MLPSEVEFLQDRWMSEPQGIDDRRALARDVLRVATEGAVREGRIRLEGRTDEEIRNDINEYTDALLAETDVQFAPQIDYQHKLINEAQRYAAEGYPSLALTFYATWFEHWLNGMYLEREPMVALEHEEIIRLIRETKLPSKTRHIWQLLFGEKLPDEVVQTILKVADVRNAFLHYKWTPGLEEEDRAEKRELHDLAQRAAAIVTQLGAIEDRIVFAGSRDRLARILDDMGPK
jgi:hypothetical protein